MNIKKVDEKSMVIHIKKKATLHIVKTKSENAAENNNSSISIVLIASVIHVWYNHLGTRMLIFCVSFI